MRKFIEHHFGLVLLLSCAAGLIVPGIPDLPNESAVVTLALLMFVSCYRLRDGGYDAIRWHDIGLFYSARYMVLPLALWALAHVIAPDYAMGVLLLSVVPAAVSSPAFAHMYGGLVPPAFVIVIASQLLAPFLIPLQFALVGDVTVAPEPMHLFITMVWCIFVPLLAYALVRTHKSSADYMYARSRFFSIILVAFVIALAIAKQREVILSGEGLIAAFILSVSCFAMYILAGWWMLNKRSREERLTYAVCSGFNNAALGVSLALLHFGPKIVLFVAVSEMAWAFLPLMMRYFLRLFLR